MATTINPNDTTFNLILETTPGTVPPTPAWTVSDYITGSEPQLSSDFITSNVLQPNGASAGGRKANFRAAGSIKTGLRRGTHLDILLQSALSNTFSGSVLKAANTPQSFSMEKIFKKGATLYFHRFTGFQATDFTLTCDAATNAEISFNLLGMDRGTDTTIITGATYVTPATSLYLNGVDVTNITIGGLTVSDFSSLELQFSKNCEAQTRFGSTSARGVGTSGIRTVSLKLRFYRDDLSADTLLAKADSKVAVSFQIGGVGTGYSVTLPACNYTVPQDVSDNSKQLIEVTFTGSFDTTAGTDLNITKL